MKKIISLLLTLCCFLTLGSCNVSSQGGENTSNSSVSDADSSEAFEVVFYRKVARQTTDNGWVFTFVRDGMKDGNDTDIIKYTFNGINIKYRYAEKYGGVSSTDNVRSRCLIFGYGSDAEQRDMDLVASILSKDKTDEELLALDPNDYTFEVLDKDIFFGLMRKSLTGEPQKEGTDPNYWDKPSYAFLAEEEYVDGYKFQVSFLNETGLIDELHIDVLFKTGEGRTDYDQLSDLVASGRATAEQKEAYELIQSMVVGIKENVSYIYNADAYRDKTIGKIDFSRLYKFLEDIHNNNIDDYIG